jgi:hypothetical protein
MTTSERWKDNWRVVCPPGAVRVDLPRPYAKRQELLRMIYNLPLGTPIVLFASGPGASRRCRSFAAEASIDLEHEFLAFPSTSTPAYIVEDARPLVRLFVKTIMVAPPRTSRALPIDAVLGVLRALHPLRLIRAAAPGRVAVGRLA